MKFYNAVYFTASWCQPCKQFKPLVIDEMAKRGVSLTLSDVDVDPADAGVNDVMSLPTIVLFGWEDGNTLSANEVGRVIGASLPTFIKALDKLEANGYNGQLTGSQ